MDSLPEVSRVLRVLQQQCLFLDKKTTLETMEVFQGDYWFACNN